MKNVLGIWKGNLKGNDRFETFENYSILFIALGALMITLGIGLTVVATKGFPVILTMIGSLLAFISTIALIATWLAREFLGG